MNERSGVVRGLSPDDAYCLYALLYFRSSSPDGTVWRPDPLDQDACLGQVRQEERTGDWVLRYSWRESESESAAAAGA